MTETLEMEELKTTEAKRRLQEAQADFGTQRDGTAKGKGRRKKMRRAVASKRQRRPVSAFPPVPFATALPFAEEVQNHGAGQQVRRLTLFEKMERSPDSSTSRDLITQAAKYGLTKGNYSSDFLQLSEFGAVATSPESQPREKLAAKFKLAIESVPIFKNLYEKNKGNRLPSPEVLRDLLADTDVPEEQRKQAVDIYLENLKTLGLLRMVSGAERVVPIEQALDDIPASGAAATSPDVSVQAGAHKVADKTKKNWKSICFVIAPIGADGNEDRKHSDMVLEQLIRKALEKGSDWEVIRADEITSPGMISGQVIEYLLHSGLVIADLSFHNPNVFYELAIRHLIGLPTVHLIRKGDKIPFDLKDFRTIEIDTTDKYDLVAKLDTYRAEISNHMRQAVAEGDEATNPIRLHAKSLSVSLN